MLGALIVLGAAALTVWFELFAEPFARWREGQQRRPTKRVSRRARLARVVLLAAAAVVLWQVGLLKI